MVTFSAGSGQLSAMLVLGGSGAGAGASAEDIPGTLSSALKKKQTDAGTGRKNRTTSKISSTSSAAQFSMSVMDPSHSAIIVKK